MLAVRECTEHAMFCVVEEEDVTVLEDLRAFRGQNFFFYSSSSSSSRNSPVLAPSRS